MTSSQKQMTVQVGDSVATTTTRLETSPLPAPCTTPAGITYTGARYITVFADPIEWNSNTTYEYLTVVQHNGDSYVSKQNVPLGIEITNTAYWLHWADYNAQIEQYRKEVAELKASTPKAFSTVAEMKASKVLESGMVAFTGGYHVIGDGGGAMYFITSSGEADEMLVIDCNGVYANLIVTDEVAVEQLGAQATANCAPYVQKAIDNDIALRFGAKTYQCSSTISTDKAFKIRGAGEYITTINVTSPYFLEIGDAQTYGPSLSDLSLVGNGSSNALNMKVTTRFGADGVRFTKFDTIINANSMLLAAFTKCHFDSSNTVLKVAKSTEPVEANNNANWFSQCYFTNITKMLIGGEAGETGNGWVFDACQLEILGGEGVDTIFDISSNSHMSNLTLSNCWIENAVCNRFITARNLATVMLNSCTILFAANKCNTLLYSDSSEGFMTIVNCNDASTYGGTRLDLTAQPTIIGGYPFVSLSGVGNGVQSNIIHFNSPYLGNFQMTGGGGNKPVGIAAETERLRIYNTNDKGAIFLQTSYKNPLQLGPSMFVWDTGAGHVNFKTTFPTSATDGSQIW